jgi:uncharacterized protein with HEPN domain
VRKQFLDYIEDILDAMSKAETFIQDHDFEHFAADANLDQIAKLHA